MKTELLGVVATFIVTFLLSIPLGKYIGKVFKREKTILDFLEPFERWIFRFCRIDPGYEMNWKEHVMALLSINLIWFVYAFIMFMVQGSLWLNPDGNPSMSAHLSFNTAASFLVNCNLQDYSGETGVTYLTQLLVLTFLHFVSAATGIAALVVVMKAMLEKVTDKLGNFYEYFILSLTRILLPLSIVISILLVFHGTPASFDGKEKVITLQGDTTYVSRGPAAGMIAIKHIGTNGGGWFGANSAHPLENPDYFTNMLEMIAQCIIPFALVFALGYYLNRRKMAWVIFTVMVVGTLCFLIPTIIAEMSGNPTLTHLGFNQESGNMEGKEQRIGAAASGYWSIMTTVISTGSVNSMHDSSMPISGAMQMLGMMTNCFFGGVGVGILNYYIFIIIAVFISGLMVGRTPELLGRKIEAAEIKLATLVALLHPFLILSFTAFSAYVIVNQPSLPWLNNVGFHGFSEMLYQFTSSAANNGSGFEGLGDNTPFWNITAGIVMLLGRFLPIIGPIAIAGVLAKKKYIPQSAGTLDTDNGTFGVMTFAVIMILAALAFFPALTLGPLAEYFSNH